VSNQPKITKRGKGAVNRCPMHSGSRCFGASYDLVGSQVFVSAVEDFDHGSTSPGDAFVLLAQQAQRNLNPPRSRGIARSQRLHLMILP
jgi:hypothetical protein